MMNNTKEPQSTLDATKCLIQILDTNYEKANLRDVVKHNCLTWSAPRTIIVTGAPTRLWEAVWWDTKLLGLQSCLHPFEGRSTAIPWLDISNAPKTCGCYQERNPKIMQFGSIAMASWLRMCFANLYSKKWTTPSGLSEIVGNLTNRLWENHFNTQNQHCSAKPRRLHICHCPWSEYGLLQHYIGPRCVKNMHHYLAVG